MNPIDSKNNVNKPAFRKLKAYAFDPSLSLQLDTSVINDITYKIPWEELKPGPVGEYIEVVDYDPSSNSFYRPVDLNNRYVLAQDGLEPSESNPQFHQQMVYAVAMTTIKNFERALGRKILWSPYRNKEGVTTDYVKRLRIYPHALREPNAYYSPLKKSVLFGYFSSMPDSRALMLPGATVYTCLSHDIIAHEVTHALLDGMHRRYVEATHTDSLAFHEAFADIVALFQHFTFPEVLKAQIAKTKGDLASQNLLGQLAQEFGKAIGHYGSLRDALGKYNEEKEKWLPLKPDPGEYLSVKEPHERGAILVATIFDMFTNIYKKRVADLQRLATGGTGVLPEGALHPDLVSRMANEASKTAGHVLNMCVRALDYCPPMDINFGDYLRALITADFDLVDDDNWDYRIAMIEAFQRRGIYPDCLNNMSVESLLLKADEVSSDFDTRFATLIEFFKLFKEKASYVTDREELHELTKVFITGGDINNLGFDKTGIKKYKEQRIKGLHQRLYENFDNRDDFGQLTGLILSVNDVEQKGIGKSKSKNTMGMPLIEIHNLKIASRVGPSGKLVNQILVTLTQKRGVVCVEDDYGNAEIKGFFIPGHTEDGWYERIEKKGAPVHYLKQDYPGKGTKLTGAGSKKVLPKGWFVYRGGATLIFDLDYAASSDNVKLKYIIKKDIDDEARMRRQYKVMFQSDEHSLNATYFGSAYGNLEAEPFAIIHKVL
jgi:hypothetical protein